MMQPSPARAAVLYNCGHEIRTSYDQGWVIIDSMSGIAGREDIWVYGRGHTGDGVVGEFHMTVARAITERVRWGYGNWTFVYIVGASGCTVYLT